MFIRYCTHTGKVLLFTYSAKSLNDELIRLTTVSFFRLFTCEGDIEHTGYDNTEHRGLKARASP